MPMQIALLPRHFATVVRVIKKARIEQVNNLRGASFRALKRLGVKRDLTKAVKGLPEGSDQQDFQSIFQWMDKIGPENKKAVRQLVAIDATAVLRTKG
jgi:hypothetical protein